jgi:hypothetical protein
MPLNFQLFILLLLSFAINYAAIPANRKNHRYL